MGEESRWLGPPSRLAEIVERVRPDRIVVAFADRRDRLPLQLLLESRVRGVIVEDAVEFYEHLTGKMAIESLNPSTLILSKGFRNHGAAEIVARIISVVGAAFGLVLSAPLLLAIAVAIKLDSRGPVLFIQSRAGRNGLPFGLLKFRTMRPSDGLHSEWARDNAHRITRVGRWLRRFRLDELPQLVNVLTRGDEPDRTATPSHLQPRNFHGSDRVLPAAIDGPARASPGGPRSATVTRTTSRKRPRRCGTTCTTSRTGRSGSTPGSCFERSSS